MEKKRYAKSTGLFLVLQIWQKGGGESMKEFLMKLDSGYYDVEWIILFGIIALVMWFKFDLFPEE